MPVANRLLIEHAISALREAGAGRIFVVTDRVSQRRVRDALAETPNAGIEFRDAGTGSAASEIATVQRIRSEVGGAPLVVHRGDALVGDLVSKELADFLEAGADAAVLYLEPETANGDTRLHGEPGPRSRAIEALGIEFLSSAIIDALRSVDGKRLSEHIAAAGNDGWAVEERVVTYGWRMHEAADNVLEGNMLALDELPSDWHPDSLLRTKVEGRAVIHPSSRLEDSLVRGPCVIGAGVTVRHAYIGPYTSVGPGCVIENAELEHSLIMNDATIRDIGWRLEHSVVGARARLLRDFRVPKAVHLHVGDDARISVS
jgi:glucose-1-phosphate thymidylyltransferase